MYVTHLLYLVQEPVLSVRMYVLRYVYVYVCVCTCICVDVGVDAGVCVDVSVCVDVNVCLCTYRRTDRGNVCNMHPPPCQLDAIYTPLSLICPPVSQSLSHLFSQFRMSEAFSPRAKFPVVPM